MGYKWEFSVLPSIMHTSLSYGIGCGLNALMWKPPPPTLHLNISTSKLSATDGIDHSSLRTYETVKEGTSTDCSAINSALGSILARCLVA